MELIQGLLLITSIHLLAAASPGPDFVLVSQQTIRNGKFAGLLTSVGIALGLSIHIIYSALGLATVIANSATLLWLIKIAGGLYLVYLGIQGIRSKPSPQTALAQDKLVANKPIKMISMGFLCNVLNPKAPVYFVALFTMVLSPNMPLYQIAIYGVWIMLLQFLWFATVVLLLSRPRINRKFQKLGHWIDRLLGGAMILIGLKLITSKLD